MVVRVTHGRVALVLILILTFRGGPGHAGEPYPYEPVVVELAGVLDREYRYGPPNYGETPGLDRRLTVYTLEFAAPIDVGTAETLSELNDAPVANVRKAQVVFPFGVHPEGQRMGEKAVLTGTLSRPISGHHFYPVIFSVAE